MKKRLLVFHPTIAPYRIDLFNSLSEAFETKIFLSYRNLRSQKFDYDKILAKFKFKPNYLRKLLTVRNRVICKGYWKEIAAFDPDVVIVSEFGMDAIATVMYKLLHHKRYKIVSICDDSYNMLSKNNDFSKIHGILRKLIVPHLDQLILVEPLSSEWYQKNFSKGISFPIISDEKRSRSEYKTAIEKSNDLIKEFDLEGKHVFLFVGRLVKIKNVDGLIRAFSRIHTKDAVLVVIGDGPEREVLQSLAHDLRNRVIFTGRLEGLDLFAWYNFASCFVLPSVQEPFGAVTNEALIGGCKCLISSNAGSQSLVEEGVNGYTFLPEDNSQLTRLIDRICMEIEPVKMIKELRHSMMTEEYQTLIASLIDNLIKL